MRWGCLAVKFRGFFVGVFFFFVGLASCQVGWLVVGFCFCCISVVFLVLLLVGLG